MLFMKTRLGLELWQTVLIYVVPPLSIGVLVAWRAIHRVTTRGSVSSGPSKRRKRIRR